MALNVAAGTETLHGYSFDDVDATQDLIFGAQHHIYTVISTIVHVVSIGTAGDSYKLAILGNGNHAGGTAHLVSLAHVIAVALQTFVFNDKFSFNGFETATYSEPLNTNAEQLLQAAQGSSVPQRYQYVPLDADVDCDIHVTFIDQNNA
jgi:hypothetical protein